MWTVQWKLTNWISRQLRTTWIGRSFHNASRQVLGWVPLKGRVHRWKNGIRIIQLKSPVNCTNIGITIAPWRVLTKLYRSYLLNYFSVKMIEYLKGIRPTIFFPSKRKEKGKIIRNIYQYARYDDGNKINCKRREGRILKNDKEEKWTYGWKLRKRGGVSKEHEDNRTKNYEKPRYRIVRIVYAPFNFTRYSGIDLYQGIEQSETSLSITPREPFN